MNKTKTYDITLKNKTNVLKTRLKTFWCWILIKYILTIYDDIYYICIYITRYKGWKKTILYILMTINQHKKNIN